MFASGFFDSVAQQLGMAILGLFLLISWYGKNNPNVKDAAKKAAANKAIDIIGRFFK